MPNAKRMFSLLIVSLILCTLPGVVLAKSGLISEQSEIKMGYNAAQEAIKQRGLSTDTAFQKKAEVVFNRLLPHVSRKNLPYKIFVTGDKEINAFAYPGGQIFVTEGLMKQVSTDDELAFVIGHELGHSDNYHIVEAIERALWADIFTVYLYQQNKDLAYVAGPVLQVGISRGYGFKNEHEADLYGFKFASQAGYNPSGGAVFFHELQKKYGDGSKSLANYINPHPKNSVRIAKQMEYLSQYSGQRITLKLPEAKEKFATIHINNRPALTIQASRGNWNTAQRAEWIAGRIARLLHEGTTITPEGFSLRTNDNGYTEIVWDQTHTIVTAWEEDATTANTDSFTLTQQWLTQLQAAFL
jgi:predicted Zn-dependent protease